jgi:hypothetical protein
MGHKRVEFTEQQKAMIYSRDRATCAFSGISLWFLDNGIRPNWEMDWVDHIRPSASGGGAELENGVCASHTFNFKKRNNTSDNVYFVKNGRITEQYIRVFGMPPQVLLHQLKRLEPLEPSDWYFNRCIANTFIGFNWRCDVEFGKTIKKRDDNYWFKSAWRRLQLFNKKRSASSIISRGLLKDPIAWGTNKLLSLESIETLDQYREWVEDIYPSYLFNSRILCSYFDTSSIEEQRDILENALQNNQTNPELLRSLQCYYESHISS